MRMLFDKHLNILESDEKEPPFLATLRYFAANFLTSKHFPQLAKLALYLPDCLSSTFMPGFIKFRRVSDHLPHD